MKKNFLLSAALVAAAGFGLPSCSSLVSHPGDGLGVMVIDFNREFLAATKAAPVPSVDDFILNVTDAKGNIIYKGPYGKSPEELSVAAGNYTVSAVSCEFTSPLFDCPQYGDTQVVSVSSGQTVSVMLDCSQLNCGIRLVADDRFRSAYPGSDIILKTSSGNLIWCYGETRTAFFLPGNVALLLTGGGHEQVICSRTMSAGQMLSLKLSATEDSEGPSDEPDGIKIKLDTVRTWFDETYVMGGSNPGGSSALAYTVSQAKEHMGEKAWVQGYVVGVATGTGKFSFEGPFSRNTNIVLGLRSGTTDPDYCLSVELAKGEIRDALNLMDNPSMQGRRVSVYGEIVSAYYGLPGVKSLSDYEL